MGAMASQITSLTIVYSTVYLCADQRKHQSSASLMFVRGIHRWPVNSPHKGPVTRKMFPFDDVIMVMLCFVIIHRFVLYIFSHPSGLLRSHLGHQDDCLSKVIMNNKAWNVCRFLDAHCPSYFIIFSTITNFVVLDLCSFRPNEK